eukprot:SAG22_NODE_2971_length_2059_cov_1.261735_1_plen_285_part_00
MRWTPTPATGRQRSASAGGASRAQGRAARRSEWCCSWLQASPHATCIEIAVICLQLPSLARRFYFSHIKEELDAANEFWLDRAGAKLLYIPNATSGGSGGEGGAGGGPPPADGFALTRVRTLLSVNGSKTAPVTNVTVRGIGFRDARATYMDDHAVPSGGDWALQRSGAIFVDGTDGVVLDSLTMERNDGNAIMVSGHNLKTKIVGCDIRWTGDNAIALFGRTDELSDGGKRGMYADNDHPVGAEVAHNIVHELGAFEKQSSMVFLAKTCAAHLHHNVFFNGPR